MNEKKILHNSSLLMSILTDETLRLTPPPVLDGHLVTVSKDDAYCADAIM